MKITIVFAALIFLGFKKAPLAKNCIYEQDGLLGKLNILNDTVQKADSFQIIRKLLVNHVVQSEMDLQTKNSVSDYVKILGANISQSAGKNALVLGLGGGLTSNLLFDKGFKVTGVELDQRIIELAKKYFYLNSSVSSVCDDARHYINISDQKFDLLLIDIFKAEEQPAHVITIESLNKIKQLLNPGAQLIINWHGYSSGEMGLGTAILINTLKKEGFNYKMAAVSDKEDYRNLVIFASLNQPQLSEYEMTVQLPATELVNSDAHPMLEKYNAPANQNWRKNYILYYYSGN